MSLTTMEEQSTRRKVMTDVEGKVIIRRHFRQANFRVPVTYQKMPTCAYRAFPAYIRINKLL
jgi:hypothetical protein